MEGFADDRPISLQELWSAWEDNRWDAFSPFKNECEKHLDNVLRTLEPNLSNELQSWLSQVDIEEILGGDLQIQLTVDSNIIIAETLSFMKKGKSFMKTLFESGFIKFFAPSKAREEVLEKIEKRLPREFKLSDAQIVALEMMSDIEILPEDALDQEAIDEAKKTMGPRDPDDVPFLAISFHFGTHGVVTRDLKHFGDLAGIEVWSLGDAGRLMSALRRGSFAFVILAEGVPVVLHALYTLLVAVMNAIVEVVRTIVSVITQLVEGAVDAADDVPWQIWAILACAGIGFLLALVLSEDFRKWVAGGLQRIGEFLMEVIDKIVEIGRKAIEQLKLIFEAMRPFVNMSLYAVGFLFYEAGSLVVEAKVLARKRIERDRVRTSAI